MKIRMFKRSDLDTVRPWYKARGEGFLEDYLPMESGFMAHDAQGDVGCAFLLMTNSPMCFMEYMMTNHERTEMEQGKALLTLAFTLEKLAAKQGYKVIIGLVPEDHFSLAKFYQRQKAHQAGKLMRLFYKGLGG